MSESKTSHREFSPSKKYFQDQNQNQNDVITKSKTRKSKKNKDFDSNKDKYFSTSSPSSHLQKTKIGPFYYVVPKFSKAKSCYNWPELRVSKSKIPNAGMGLFSTTFLPKFTVLPYLGDVLDFRSTIFSLSNIFAHKLDKKDKRRFFLLRRAPGLYVDGYSSRHTAINKNISVTGYINEASSPFCPNALIYKSYFVTTRDIFPNEELYADYGPLYYSRNYSVERPKNCIVSLGKKAKLILPLSKYKEKFNIQETIWKDTKECEKWFALRLPVSS